MGTIKDIADLTIDLINSTQDRKLTAKITEIQSLIATLQSEHSAIIEKNAQVVTVNLDLKKKIFELKSKLEEKVFALKREQAKVEMQKLRQPSSQRIKQTIAKVNEQAKKRAKSYSV